MLRFLLKSVNPFFNKGRKKRYPSLRMFFPPATELQMIKNRSNEAYS